MTRNSNPIRAGRPVAASSCGLLLVVAALTAAANSQYDSTSLNGNLQNQCTNFTAAVVLDTSFTISAECNKEGTTSGSVAASRNSTSFDLAGDVRWNLRTHALTWDTALTAWVNDIADDCNLDGATPFTYSASDVTLALSCNIETTDGTPRVQNVSLTLNGHLQAGTDGNLSRR